MCNHRVAWRSRETIELDAGIDEVWAFLTDPDELAGWVGDEVRGADVDRDAIGRRLTWTWAPDGVESTVELTVTTDGGRTSVTVVERAASRRARRAASPGGTAPSSTSSCARCRGSTGSCPNLISSSPRWPTPCARAVLRAVADDGPADRHRAGGPPPGHPPGGRQAPRGAARRRARHLGAGGARRALHLRRRGPSTTPSTGSPRWGRGGTGASPTSAAGSRTDPGPAPRHRSAGSQVAWSGVHARRWWCCSWCCRSPSWP